MRFRATLNSSAAIRQLLSAVQAHTHLLKKLAMGHDRLPGGTVVTSSSEALGERWFLLRISPESVILKLPEDAPGSRLLEANELFASENRSVESLNQNTIGLKVAADDLLETLMQWKDSPPLEVSLCQRECACLRFQSSKPVSSQDDQGIMQGDFYVRCIVLPSNQANQIKVMEDLAGDVTLSIARIERLRDAVTSMQNLGLSPVTMTLTVDQPPSSGTGSGLAAGIFADLEFAASDELVEVRPKLEGCPVFVSQNSYLRSRAQVPRELLVNRPDKLSQRSDDSAVSADHETSRIQQNLDTSILRVALRFIEIQAARSENGKAGKIIVQPPDRIAFYTQLDERVNADALCRMAADF